MIKLKCRVDFKRIDNIDFCTQKKKWKEAIVKMKTQLHLVSNLIYCFLIMSTIMAFTTYT